MILKQLISVIVSCVLILTLGTGCGKYGRRPKKVAAKVNKDIIYVDDLKKELAFRAKQYPLFKVTPQTLQDQLNMIIQKRLLIQQAKNKRLDEKEKFVNTIKAFWEQTLIRDLISAKEKEFGASIVVTNAEALKFYELMSSQITFYALKRKDKNSIQQIFNNPADEIEWDEEIGPITYDDASSDVIYKVFEMPEGVKRILKDQDYYYLIYVAKKEKIPVMPYEEMTDEIKRKIKNIKIQGMFREWLNKVKEESSITVNKDALKGFTLRHDE